MQSSSQNGSEPGTTNRYTRWLSLVILPFLVIASVILFVFPASTEQLFAWTITPPLMAMVLGATYLGGVWFFAHVLVHKQWLRVAHGFPAVVVFATLLAIATLIHWDRFHHGHISFITWGILYATTPVLVLVAIITNGRAIADASTPGGVDPQVPFVARMVLACIGFVALATGLTLFLIPAAFVDVWAWQLTPLTARVMGAILTLPGMVNLWLVTDPRWVTFRSLLQAQLFSLVFLLLALVLGANDLNWDNIAAPLFVGGIILSLIGYAAVYLRCEVVSRSSARR